MFVIQVSFLLKLILRQKCQLVLKRSRLKQSKCYPRVQDVRVSMSVRTSIPALTYAKCAHVRTYSAIRARVGLGAL